MYSINNHLKKNLKNRSISFNHEDVDNVIQGYDNIKILVRQNKKVVYEVTMTGKDFWDNAKDMGDSYVLRF